MLKKHILITGSTDGIGKSTAIKLIKEGHNVYLHGRNKEKLDRVISELSVQLGIKTVTGFVADFSNLDAVKTMAQAILKQVPRLDVLINNAGVFNSAHAYNAEGLDMRLVVNYLAPYVLTEALLPLLEKHHGARIVNLSSAAQDPIDQDLFQEQSPASERQRYGQSKLALTMWSFDLANRLKNTSVIAVNPGSLLDTKMAKNAFGQVWSSADKGVQILYDLSVARDYEGITGRYFDNDKGGFSEAHPDAYNNQIKEQLLESTHQVLHL